MSATFLEISLFAFAAFIVGSYAVASRKAHTFEKEFLVECQVKYTANACHTVAEAKHHRCERKSTPRRYHHRSISARQPDGEKYLSCMMKEARDFAWRGRTVAEREAFR